MGEFVQRREDLAGNRHNNIIDRRRLRRQGGRVDWRRSLSCEEDSSQGPKRKADQAFRHRRSLPFHRPSWQSQQQTLSMEFVPNDAAYQSQDVTPDERDDYEGSGGYGIERSDDIDGLDHVRPENEIDQRLRPAGGYETCPDEMPSTE